MADNIEVDGDERPVISQGGRSAPRRRWTRRLLTIGIALAALGGFVALVLSGYDRGKQPADAAGAPVIKADAGPSKIRPQQPGGMDVPNQDKQIYGRIAPTEAPPPVERLIPPPEANVARPPPAPPVALQAPERAAPQEPATSPPPPAAETAAKAVPPPAAVAPPPPPAAAAPPPPPPPPPEAARPKPSAPPPAPAARSTPPARTAAASPAAGRYRVQLGSLRSEDAAKRQWADLSRRHADLFGKLHPSVVRADLGKKGVFWRLYAGPLADSEAAQALCHRAKERKIGCFIVRP